MNNDDQIERLVEAIGREGMGLRRVLTGSMRPVGTPARKHKAHIRSPWCRPGIARREFQ